MGRARCAVFLLLATVVGISVSQDSDTGHTAHPNAQQIEKLCKDRPEDEYFRLTTEGDCRDVVRCDRAGLTGSIRLAGVKCPNGLAFDIFKQTCDWKGRVTNCDKLESECAAPTFLFTCSFKSLRKGVERGWALVGVSAHHDHMGRLCELHRLVLRPKLLYINHNPLFTFHR